MKKYLLIALLLSPVVVLAESVPGAFSRDAVGVKSYPAAPRLAEQALTPPAAILGAADSSQIEEIHLYNESGGDPQRTGFARRFPELVSVRLNGAVASKGATTTSDRIVWSGTFKVDGAHRLRLHLENVKLPAGAVLWVYGDGDTPVAFDRDLVDETGSLWTPSVRGGNVHLEIEIPRADAELASFDVNEVMQLIAPRTVTKPDDQPTCLIDVQCVTNATLPDITSIRRAIGYMEYVKGNGSFICSGGLLNDFDTSTFVPLFLTANHCISTQASATSLEVFWDWRFASCESPTIPDSSGFPRSNGATLLGTGTVSDYTLLRLGSVPANRFFLGWNTTPPAHGTVLHRISHPAPDQTGPLPEMYSNTNVDTAFSVCSGVNRPQFIYSKGGQGGVYGGSSGSPVLLPNGQVVGQLLGSCGPAPEAGCDARNATVDGAFATSYPLISQHFGGAPAPQCTPSATTVCLNNDRFSISVVWRTSNSSGTGRAIEYTPDSALFWFFNESNIEMLVKVLNGCGLNQKYWVFSAATTDVEYTITATDTKTGQVKTYFHPLGTAAPAVTDTSAFGTCP